MPKVCIDERQAGQLAVAHLLETGYRKIFCLPVYGARWEEIRFAGARREAGAAFHLPDRENLDLLSETHGDYHTPTTPERAQRHADIADRTIGFDDHPYASLLGITSIGQPLELIGRTRARILHQAVRDDLDMLQARVRCRLVVRSSTRS